MTEVQILDIMYEAFQLAMKLSLPFLLLSMIVGVVIAVFQAATQINEQTMTFVPKLLAIMVLLGFLGSSMLVMLQEFFQYIVEKIYVYHIFNGSDAYERSHRIQSTFWKK